MHEIVLPPARRYGGLAAVSDYWIVGCAIAAFAGAWFAWDLSRWMPWWLTASALVFALVARLPAVLVVGVLVLAAGSASHELARLAQPASGPIDEGVLIVADPKWRRGALSLQVRVSSTGYRYKAYARGPVAYRLEDALLGERWHLTGKAETADEDSGRYLWPRHLVGDIQVNEAHFVDAGSAPFRFANSVRGLVSSSSKSLSQRDQSLLAGFVYGDDREQLPEVLHDFRATSLTHLLAVSGSNVAFVLLLVAPLLVRLRLWWRLVAVVVLLAEFALITRAEPSVLRACVLAAMAVGAQAVGRSASTTRLLALAVTVLVVADPLLVHAAGFQLSVAAAGGIVLGASAIERRLRGPRWLRLALSITLAAQLGVLPVQLWLFGSLPLVSVPANVLAGPMAGPAMIWGLVAGVLGGLAGDAVAAVLHLPTQFMVGWVAAVARYAAALNWPAIEPSELVLLAGVVAVAFAARRFVGRALPTGGALLAGGTSLTSRAFLTSKAARLAIIPVALVGVWFAASTHEPEPVISTHLEVIEANGGADRGAGGATDGVAGGITGGVIGGVIVVMDRPDPAWALDRLADVGVRDIDLLVALSPSRSGREAVRAIQSRHQVDELWTPPGFGTLSASTSSVRVITEPTPLPVLLANRALLVNSASLTSRTANNAAGNVTSRSSAANGIRMVEPSGDNRLALSS